MLTGARLLIAHYWAGVNQWTLVDSSVLQQDGEHVVLDLSTAMCANELGVLGDRVITTASTLVLSLFATADGETPASEFDPEIANLPWPFKVITATFTCDGKPMLDPVERAIARALFFYGGGHGESEMEVDEDGELRRLTITWSSPAGPDSPVVGSHLSQISPTGTS